MTAIDFLIEKLQVTRDWQRVINEANQSNTSVTDVIYMAKQIEKRQIKDAFYDGKHQHNNWEEGPNQYYTEMYGGNNGK